jgi:hypothetical protein
MDRSEAAVQRLVVDTAPTNTGPKSGRGHWDGFQATASPAGHGPIGGRGSVPEVDSALINRGPLASGNAPQEGSRRGG